MTVAAVQKPEVLKMTLGDLLKFAAKPVATPKNGIRKLAAKKATEGTIKAESAVKTPPSPSNACSPDEIVLMEETNTDGEVVLSVKQPAYNHYFRGFCYHEVVKKHGLKAWKWDRERGVYVVPFADTALLLEGLRKAYDGKGKTLVMGKDRLAL